MTWDSGWPAMRNKSSRRRWLLALALLGAMSLPAADTPDETAVAPPRDTTDHIEYQREKLSDEAARPGKEMSDEQAVPFPDNF